MRPLLVLLALSTLGAIGCTNGGSAVTPADAPPFQRWLTTRTNTAAQQLGFALTINLDDHLAQLWHDGEVVQTLEIQPATAPVVTDDGESTADD